MSISLSQGTKINSQFIIANSGNTYGTNYSYLGVGGFYELATTQDRDNIPVNSLLLMNSDGFSSGRRRLGMIVHTLEDDKYWQLLPQLKIYYKVGNVTFTVSATTERVSEVVWDTLSNPEKLVLLDPTASVFDSTTNRFYFGSGDPTTAWYDTPLQVYITGGTYNSGTTTLELYDTSGNTISITGLTDGPQYDTKVTAFTYNNNTFTINDNSGNTFNATINNVTGLTVNGTLSATTISGGTLYGDGFNLTNIKNIYNIDGSLISNRTLSLNSFNLTISGTSPSRFFANGRLAVGTTSDLGNQFVVSSIADPVRFENMSTITADTFLVTANSNGVLRELGGPVANRIPHFNSSSAITTTPFFEFRTPTGTATLVIPGTGEGATGSQIRLNNGRTLLTSTSIGGLDIYVGNGQTGGVIDQTKQINFQNNGRNYLTLLAEGGTTTATTASTRAAFTSRVSIDTGTTPLGRNYWGTTGVAFSVAGRPWVDITSTGGTRTDLAYTSFGIPIFSALSGTNYNGIYTVYIDGPPTLSTNVSGTTYALYTRTGNILFGNLQSNNTDTRILTTTSSGLIRYRNFSDFTGGTGGVSGDYLPLSGGTVTGDTIFQSGLTATTISASTYFNLPIDPDSYVTGFTLNSDIITLTQNRTDQYSAFTISLSAYTGNTGVSGDYLPLSGGTVTGDTIFQSGLTATTISATTISGNTLYGDGSNITNIQNIYNTDGFLSSNRTLNLSGRTLTFKQGSTGVTETLLNFVDGANRDLFQIRSQYFLDTNTFDPYTGNSSSIYIGLNAGASATGVSLNTVIGSNALRSLVSGGNGQVAIGSDALRGLTGGCCNVGVGDMAGGSLVSGSDNIFIGQRSARLFTGGTANVFIGANVVDRSTSGSSNVMIGKTAGDRVVGDNNVMIGREAGGSATPRNSSGNVFLGFNAGRSEIGSNLLYIENSSSINPLIYGDFLNDLLRFNAKVAVGTLPTTFDFDVNGTSRFSNTVRLDTVNSGNTDLKILTLSPSNVIRYRDFSDFSGGTGISGDYLPLSGGTVTGNTIFQSGLTANTISATTYLNLPINQDTFVTGFTLNSDIITLTQNRTDQYSAFTISLSAYTGNTVVSGDYLPLSGGTVTGDTIFQSGLTATTISATTYLNLPVDPDVYVTGFTYSANTFYIYDNSGNTFDTTFNDVTGLTVNGDLNINTSLNTTAIITANTGTNTVYSIPTSAYTGAFFDYTVSNSAGLRAGNVMSIWSGTTAKYTEVSTTDIGDTSPITFSVGVSGGNAVLSASATTNNWVVKVIIRSI